MSDMSKLEAGNLIAVDKITGTDVFSAAGQKLGTIEDLMLDRINGKVVYAVLSFGGFLGLGDKHYPLPWASMRYDTRYDGFVVDLDEDGLRDAPAYGPQEPIDWTADYGRRIDAFYKVPRIWQ